MIAAEVYLWETKVGTLAMDEDSGISTFLYDREFLSSGIEIAPIRMPLSPRQYRFPSLPRETFHGLPGIFADSLPDKFGNRVINAWLSKQGRSPDSFSPIERLLYTGKRGMGALEYRPVMGPTNPYSSAIDIDELVKLANAILSEREEISLSYKEDDLKDILLVGTSAGGARAKAVIAWNEETGEIRSGQAKSPKGFSYWIIKFDNVSNNKDKETADGPEYTRIEYAYYLMARQAGISMNECRLEHRDKSFHFMSKRFDREEETGDKIHMVSLCGMAHFDFNEPGAHSYEEAVDIMKRLNLGKEEVEELYRRMVFNVLARNHDDHAKNISFLMDRRGVWHLAPAYDVTYAYNPGGKWTSRHQMSIYGKLDGFTREDLLASAKTMNIPTTAAEKIIQQVEASLSSWMKFADEAHLSRGKASMISKAFLHL